MHRKYYVDLNYEFLSTVAKLFFRMTLHPDKVKVTFEEHEIKFLGYQVNGYTFVKDNEDEFFNSIVCTEHTVDSLEKSATRMLAYMLLGGCKVRRF